MIRFWRSYDGDLFRRSIATNRIYRVAIIRRLVIAWEKKA